MEDEPLEARGGGRPQSTTRVYIGNLPPNVARADVENHFNTHGTGKISEIKLMTGFGFLEYEDPLDARDVVPNLHGTEFMGNRLTVQFARGPRERDPRAAPMFNERGPPRTRRTVYRMTMSGLPPETSWQDLKDFARLDGLDVVYSEIPRERDGSGFVEYETEADLNNAVAKIDGREFRGATVQCAASIQPERPRDNRYRSRSPPMRRGGYGAPPPRDYQDDYYDRRGPPRPYSTRGYRDRSPPPRRGYYDDRGGYPPPRGSRGPPPADDYPPRRGYPAEDYPPPPRGGGYGASRAAEPYGADPYVNGGRSAGYDRPPSPRRRSPPPPRSGGGYDRGYDRPAYW